MVGYATDRPVTMAAFTLAGQLYVAELASGLTPRLVETPGGVIDPRPDPHGRLVAYVSRRRAARARRHHPADHRARRAGRPEVSPTASPSSSRPRRWAGCAATGGRPTGDALLVARVDDTPVPRWHIADPAHPDRPRRSSPTRRRARRTPGSTLQIVGLDGAAHPGSLGRRPRRVPGRPRVWDAARAAHRRAAPRPAGPADAAGRPGDRGHRPRPRADRPGLGGHRPRRARAHRRRRAGHHGRARGRAPAGRRRRARSPRRRCRSADVLDVDGDTVLISAEHRPGLDQPVVVEPGRAARAHPRNGRAHRPAGRGHPRGRPARTSNPTAPRRRCAPRRRRVTIPSLADPPGLVPRITLLSVGRARPPHRGAAADRPRPGTRLPVLMDPYGGPHAQRVRRRPRTRTSPASGSPTRGSRWSSSTAGAPPGAARSGSAPSTTTSPAPVLEDQVDALHAVAAAAPRPRPGAGSASAAGPSAGTSPRSPCCAAPTSSTPRSRGPGHRLGALRHPLHRALPRPPRRPTRRRTRAVVAHRRRRQARSGR